VTIVGQFSQLNMSKIDHSLFAAHESTFAEEAGPCPQCGEELHIRRGKKGPFIGCSHYPACDFSKPLHEVDNAEITVIEGSCCPECAENLVIRKGRYGMFIGCSNFPQCHYIESPKQQVTVNVACPSCARGEIQKRANKFGKNFYPCDQYPQCRYALNFPPVAQQCPSCEWPVMQEKKTAKGMILQCPQRKCMFKQPLE
jgi:putative DNA topoisomerase